MARAPAAGGRHGGSAGCGNAASGRTLSGGLTRAGSVGARLHRRGGTRVFGRDSSARENFYERGESPCVHCSRRLASRLPRFLLGESACGDGAFAYPCAGGIGRPRRGGPQWPGDLAHAGTMGPWLPPLPEHPVMQVPRWPARGPARSVPAGGRRRQWREPALPAAPSHPPQWEPGGCQNPCSGGPRAASGWGLAAQLA